MRPHPAAFLALLLAACSPPAPPAEAPQSDAPPTVEISGPYAAALRRRPVTGSWRYRADAGVSSACFGNPESECSLIFQCETRPRVLTVGLWYQLIPDQPTVLRVVTPVTAIDLDAHSSNEGLPVVDAKLAGHASPAQAQLIDALSPAQERFGLEVPGESDTFVFPWHDSVARVLEACR